jgi:arsenite-transporting ATPase
MLGLPEGEDALTGKMESTRKIVEQVNTQFKDPDMTTFVCVCIPEVHVYTPPPGLCGVRL